LTIAAAAAGSGTGEGTGTGPGQGSGSGPGSGGGSGGGEGGGIGSGVGPGIGRGRLLAPSPTLILVPPTAPREIKGRTFVVRLDVDSVGVVKAVELIPSTGDRKYDDKLREAAFGWKFRPARDAANRPVPARFDVEFTF
jgi:protein TonB